MKISAVIFDLDGTLTDSVKHFHKAVAHMLSTHGIAMQEEHFHVWHTNFHPWSTLFGLHGKSEFDEDEVERVTMAKLQEYLAAESAWMDGAEETVNALKARGMPMAVFTASPDQSIDTMSKSLPLRQIFPVIISAEVVKERRKPDPYGALLAAERLGVSPADCLYVGDQRFDMMAAAGAGMHECLFLGPHTPPDAELMTDRKVRKLPEILKFID